MRRRTESKTKKRMSAEDRKEAILETTVSFISQFGFWGFTIRDVAQAQNITEAGLLYYFKSKEQLLEATLKYADRTNQIAIAEHLGVEGVTGEVLQDGIAYHCDLGLKAISTGTVETNAGRPEMVRLYTLLESEALSKDHPVHEYFEQREINLLKEYTFAAKRDGVAKSGTHRTASAIRHGRLAIAVAQRISRYRFRWRMEGPDRSSHSLNVLFSSSLLEFSYRRFQPAITATFQRPIVNRSPCLTAAPSFSTTSAFATSSTLPSVAMTTGATTTSPSIGLATVTSSAE